VKNEKQNYSVLMSVYKKENPSFFTISIDSMISQTIQPEQIVIVKDGPLSTELDSIINKFEKTYPGLFTIVSLRDNVGLGLALNEGLKKCRNELVARMDADDISHKKRCEIQVETFLNNRDLSIVGSIIDEFEKNPDEIISTRVVPTDYKSILKFSRRRNPFNHPSVMYKKSAVLKNNGYGDFRRNQDFDLFVRMLNKGFKAQNINQSLVLFRADKSNIKRRKSWTKCKGNIMMILNFWKKGYSSFTDFLIVSLGQVVVYISPIWLFEWISNKFLRKSKTI